MIRGKRSIVGFSLGTMLVWQTPAVTFAQEQEVASAGKPTFERNCAGCHGHGGKGDGPAMNLLTVKPADLTQLSRRNNGTFPFWQIYRKIDGREEIRAHGSRDMPIWGAEFRSESTSNPAAQTQVRGRILELVFYLLSIQEK